MHRRAFTQSTNIITLSAEKSQKNQEHLFKLAWEVLLGYILYTYFCLIWIFLFV